jgi:hypothetical protein
MSHEANVLDDLLPLLEPVRAELHDHIAVLEVAEPAQLVELASRPAIRRLLLARLSDTVALIDPGSEHALITALRKDGHTPKVVEGVTA